MKFDFKEIINEVTSKNFWPRLIIMTISVFIVSLNYNIFLLRNDLVIGGVSGIATILHSFIDINPGTFILISNVILLILSFFLLGPRSTGLTIIGSILFPIFITLTGGIAETIASNINIQEFVVITVVSGVIYGTANGFIYKTGYSTGGTDIIMMIVSKYCKIPTGTATLIIDSIIVGVGALTFGLTKAIYALIIIFINSILINKIMLGISSSKMFYIQTDKTEEVERFIKEEMHTGYTIMNTDNGNKDKRKNIIMCVLSTRDYFMVKNVIRAIDPEAFFIISDCYEVYGGQRKPQFPFI
jgi:uncharacterized membrane-anchored protein YitT (DUF2179 family)